MFYSIPNLRAATASELAEPWNYKDSAIPEAIVSAEDKERFRIFCNSFTTKHAFISMVEGLDPRVRVSYEAGNPAYRIHGLIADYDSTASDLAITERMASPPCEFLPAYACRTFSGNLRVIWEFEKPLMVSTKEQFGKFIVYLGRKLKLSKWFGGLDTTCLGNPQQYYEIGTDWKVFQQDAPIPASMLEFWLYDAAKDIPIVDDTSSLYDIPIETVAAEVEKRFGNRWRGPFELGRRGVRFWDPSADNETAAIVRKDGMQCFTGGKSFVSWREILGNQFVEAFEANKFSRIIEKSCYDGRNFWVQRGANWVEVSKEDFTQFLRVQGLKSSRKGGGPSEIDRVEVDIKTHRAVKAALPFVHHPQGVILHKSERYLNYSSVRCLPPAPPVTEDKLLWSDGTKYFPWLYEFFRGFFEPVTKEGAPDQLEMFLGWLKHFYENGLNQEPRSGQVLIIAGPAGRGKTLLSNKILSMMVGGHEDASAYLVEGSQWSDHICEMPLMVVDDDLPGADHKTQLRFTALLKKITANMSLTYNGKFKKQGRVPWMGRIMITCNLDPESLRILPNMDISVIDKISLFKASELKGDYAFPTPSEISAILARELPYFCRFLLDWRVPVHVGGDSRFGVRAYHHDELFKAANRSGAAYTVLEIIKDFMAVHNENKPEAKGWEGRAVSLYRQIANTGDPLIQKYNMQQFSNSLSVLASKGFGIKHRVYRGSTLWFIPSEVAPTEDELLESDPLVVDVKEGE